MTGPILRLTGSVTHLPIYVNFALVHWFGPYGNDATMLAQQIGDVYVSETPEQIVERLGDTDSVWVGVE